MPMHKVMLGATAAPICMQHLEGVSKPAKDLILAMLGELPALCSSSFPSAALAAWKW